LLLAGGLALDSEGEQQMVFIYEKEKDGKSSCRRECARLSSRSPDEHDLGENRDSHTYYLYNWCMISSWKS